MNTRELLSRYLDDRDSLSELEWETLIAELNKSPTLVAELRDQLILDDYLAQKLALDRMNFLSQVGQRVNDYDKQVADTFDQVRELRSFAEAELTKPSLKPAPSWWTWGSSVGIVTATALVVVAVLWQINWNQPVAVAVVDEVTGKVAVKVGGNDVQLEKGTTLDAGQEVTTGEDGSVEWKYADGTRIRLEANAKARLARHPEHEGKRVFLDEGSLWGDIEPQLGNRPMTFVTPHAEAKVLGTRFQLVVHEQDSELEVTEGVVNFSRVGSGETIRVEANRVSVIGQDRMELTPVDWPGRDDDLVFKFTHIEREDGSLTRKPDDTNKLLVTPLLARGDVDVWQNRGLMLNGGSYHSPEAGEDLLKLFKDHDRRELTVEVVLAAEEMGDMPMTGSGTILSLATKGNWGNFSLRTAEGQWIAMLRTDTGEALQPLKWTIDNSADSRLHHVAWTYRDGEWKGYCDGKLFVSSSDVHGSFNWIPGELTVGADEDASQPWRGIVFGFAVYRRVLSQEELAEKARHARVVYEPFAK